MCVCMSRSLERGAQPAIDGLLVATKHQTCSWWQKLYTPGKGGAGVQRRALGEEHRSVGSASLSPMRACEQVGRGCIRESECVSESESESESESVRVCVHGMCVCVGAGARIYLRACAVPACAADSLRACERACVRSRLCGSLSGFASSHANTCARVSAPVNTLQRMGLSARAMAGPAFNSLHHSLPA